MANNIEQETAVTKPLYLGPIAALALTIGFAAAAAATPVYTVDAWIGDLKADHVGGTDANNVLPGPAADAHFTIAGPIDWITSRGTNLVQDFLTQDGAVALPAIAGYSSPSAHYATLASFLAASMSTGGDAYSAFFHITGTYDSAASYAGTVRHDDGASLYIDNGATQIFGHAPETSAITNSFVLPAGTHNFDLYYVEGNGAPSVLKINFPTNVVPTPEPAALALFATGLLGLGLVRRRRNA